MRQEARAKSGKELGRKIKLGLKVGGAIVTATVVLVEFGPKAVRSFNHSLNQAQQQAIDREEQYNGPFRIPTENESHRVLYAGREYGSVILGDVSSVADYVHEHNPKISASEVTDLVMAEDTEVQRREGVPEGQIDPTLLASGPILLPPQYGVGTLVSGADANK